VSGDFWHFTKHLLFGSSNLLQINSYFGTVYLCVHFFLLALLVTS